MTNHKNEPRIIRVSGCHDCPCIRTVYYADEAIASCKKLNISVYSFARTKTLPDNCPLDKKIEMKELEPIRKALAIIIGQTADELPPFTTLPKCEMQRLAHNALIELKQIMNGRRNDTRSKRH